MSQPLRGLGLWLVVSWGVGGVLLLLGQAVYRLAPWALEAALGGLTRGQWALCAIWVAVSMYAEGHRGFHKRFSPRVVARAYHLVNHPRGLHIALAPAFCMSFFHANLRGKITAWGLTCGIAVLVVLVRMLDQPWRGIVDAGVVVGLFWGAVSIVVHWVRAVRMGPRDPTDLPEAADDPAFTSSPSAT